VAAIAAVNERHGEAGVQGLESEPVRETADRLLRANVTGATRTHAHRRMILFTVAVLLTREQIIGLRTEDWVLSFVWAGLSPESSVL